MPIKKYANYAVFGLLLLLPWQTRFIFGQVSLLGESISLGVLSFYATQVVIIALFLLAMIFIAKESLFAKYTSPQLVALGAFVFYAIFRATQVWHIDLALVHLAALGFAGLLYWLFTQKVVDRKLLLMGVSISLVAPVILGLWQVVFGASGASTLLGLAARDAQVLGESIFTLGGERFLRAYGGFPHPNIFAGYLLVGIWCAWRLCHLERAECESKDPSTSLRMTQGLLIFLIIGLLATGSQAALLGLVAAGLWVLLRPKGEYKLPFAIVVTGITLLSVWVGDGASFIERQDQYLAFSQLFEMRELILGAGPMHYLFELAIEQPGLNWWLYQPIHNSFLLILAELGMIGAGLLGYLVWPNLKQMAQSPYFPLILAFLPPFLLDHYLWTTWSGMVIVVLLLVIDTKQENH
jgi:hypothetical protein